MAIWLIRFLSRFIYMWNQPRDCGRKTQRLSENSPKRYTPRGKPRSRTRGTCEKVEYYWRAELSIRHRWPWVIGGLARTELAILLHERFSLSCCARSINPRKYRIHFYGGYRRILRNGQFGVDVSDFHSTPRGQIIYLSGSLKIIIKPVIIRKLHIGYLVGRIERIIYS